MQERRDALDYSKYTRVILCAGELPEKIEEDAFYLIDIEEKSINFKALVNRHIYFPRRKELFIPAMGRKTLSDDESLGVDEIMLGNIGNNRYFFPAENQSPVEITNEEFKQALIQELTKIPLSKSIFVSIQESASEFFQAVDEVFSSMGEWIKLKGTKISQFLQSIFDSENDPKVEKINQDSSLRKNEDKSILSVPEQKSEVKSEKPRPIWETLPLSNPTPEDLAALDAKLAEYVPGLDDESDEENRNPSYDYPPLNKFDVKPNNTVPVIPKTPTNGNN